MLLPTLLLWFAVLRLRRVLLPTLPRALQLWWRLLLRVRRLLHRAQLQLQLRRLVWRRLLLWCDVLLPTLQRALRLTTLQRLAVCLLQLHKRRIGVSAHTHVENGMPGCQRRRAECQHNGCNYMCWLHNLFRIKKCTWASQRCANAANSPPWLICWVAC